MKNIRNTTLFVWCIEIRRWSNEKEIKTNIKELNMIEWDENHSFDILMSWNKIIKS